MIVWRGWAVSLNRRLIPIVKNNKPAFKLSTDYQQFVDEICQCCIGQKRFGSLIVDLEIEEYIDFGRDTDNYLKGICDGLSQAQLIDDDRFIKNIKITRRYKTDKTEHDEIKVIIKKADSLKL